MSRRRLLYEFGTNDTLLHVPYKVVLFLIFFGFAYFFSGLIHQLSPHKNEYPGTPIEWHIFWRIFLISLARSSEKVFGLSFALYHYGLESETERAIKWIYTVSVVSVIYVVSISAYIMIEPPDALPAGASMVVSFVVLVIVCIVKICETSNRWRAPLCFLLVGGSMQIIALLIRILLRSYVVRSTSCSLRLPCEAACICLNLIYTV